MSDFKNTLTAIILTVAIIFGWQYFYDKPRLKAKQKQIQATKSKVIPKQQIPAQTAQNFFASRLEAINKTTGDRVVIDSPKLKGSISLSGARIDDLVLPEYKATLAKDSSATILLSPSKYKNAYFAEFGWLSATEIEIPNSNTVWYADKKTLKANDNIILSWQNSEGVIFNINIALDSNYMFTITQTVKNQGSRAISLSNYGLINRIINKVDKSKIAYEGPIGVFNNVLKEVSYKDLESDKVSKFDNNFSGSWFGISDKYWLTAIIPQNLEGKNFNTKFQYANHIGKNKVQADYISDTGIIQPGNEASKTINFFAGAKVLSILDNYEKKYNISLFDRAIDFGWFYFITKPMFNALKYFYNLFGNFGISILVVTIIIKLFLFPLANKSYKSMNRMKVLQPKINSIRELYADDKMKQNQEILQLYKREKVSPLSGCLPLFVQIPIFFSLYKVLFITIEMRHAPFYGWIKDLSAPDPTTIFNLFGLLSFTPPSFLMIGAWPIIMALTMFFQQSFSPEPADPIQAKVMKFLPLFFLFMFASFPAGLVIYWAWSNMLSIAQQYGISFMHEKNKKD